MRCFKTNLYFIISRTLVFFYEQITRGYIIIMPEVKMNDAEQIKKLIYLLMACLINLGLIDIRIFNLLKLTVYYLKVFTDLQ